MFLQEHCLGGLLGLHQQLQPSHGAGQVGIQAQVCLRRLPQSQADHSVGQTQLLWSDGETNPTISSVHSPAPRPSKGDTSGT